MRFQDLPVSELKNIIEKYKDRTTIKGYKSMKKSELVIELGNRFSIIVNGNLYLMAKGISFRPNFNQKALPIILKYMKLHLPSFDNEKSLGIIKDILYT